jgi:glycosidase
MRHRYGTLQTANRAAKKISATLSLALTLLVAPAPAAHAQALAQRGWMDSALSTKSWWKHLVIYEIDTRKFQDSNGDGIGDLKGITQRLDYLHSLGVDAILLDSLMPKASTAPLVAPIDPVLGTPDDFDTLSLEASRRNIRILLSLSQPDLGPDLGPNLGMVRYWLNRGVAGFRILPADASADAPNSAPASLQDLHKLLAGAIGQRILIASPPSGASAAFAPQLLPISSILSVPNASDPSASSAPGAAPPASQPNTVAQLRAALEQAAAATHGDQPPIPLLLTDAPDHPRSVNRFGDGKPDSNANATNAKLIAAVLLGTRAAALIDYGQEIGLTSPTTTDPQADPQMKWGNAPAQPTADAAPAAAPAPPSPAPGTGFGVYRPYVPPTANPKLVAAPADPTTVAGQENDPTSLLSFYHQLTELHRGNPTLRDGDTIPLDHDAQNLLVWVRKPRAITPLSPAIVVLCNFSSAPVTLSLKADMTRLHLRGSFLRTILRSDNAMGTMHLDGMTLPPHEVYIGELRY